MIGFIKRKVYPGGWVHGDGISCQAVASISRLLECSTRTRKVLEVHEKSDLVPAPVHEEKNDCVPQSDHEIWQKSDLSSRSRSRSWHIIICFNSRVEVTNFDISQNISGMLNTFGCSKLFY